MAYACYHRQNLAYRPNTNFSGQNYGNSNFGNPSGGYSGTFGYSNNGKPVGYGGNSGQNYGQFAGANGNLGYGNIGHSAGYTSNSGTAAQVMFAAPDAMGYYGQLPSCNDYNGPGSFGPCVFPQQPQVMSLSSGFGEPSAPHSSTPWYFDSGATSHVTHDSSQIQSSNGGMGANAVTVGRAVYPCGTLR